MRVYVETDLEGVSGVCVWEQTRDRDSAMYQVARKLLMGDIAALVDGLIAGGATEVTVDDGHGGGFNFMPDLMDPRANYVTGRSRPGMADRTEQYQGAGLPCHGGHTQGFPLPHAELQARRSLLVQRPRVRRDGPIGLVPGAFRYTASNGDGRRSDLP